MKAAVYLRVSQKGCRCGHRQERHEAGVGKCRKCLCAAFVPKQDEVNQEPDCLRVCTARGWGPVFFRERVSGAASKVRPQWQAVKDAAHRGEVGAVVIWALDRAGRDRVRLSHDLAEFARKGVTVVSVKESWLDQPAGAVRELLIQIFGWFAQSERERLIERTIAGQATARARGVHIGRPPAEPEDVRRMEAEWRKGTSAFLAARALGLAESTVRNYFRRWNGRKFNPYPCKPGGAGGGRGGAKQGGGG